MVDLTKDINDNYIRELTYKFLEEAPTLFGLPIDFLPTDIIANNKKGFIYLDFTISENLEAFINKIVNGISKKKKRQILLEFSGKELDETLLSEIRMSYFIHFYNKIHLSTKETCSLFLKGLLEKYTKELSSRDSENVLTELKLKDDFYDRGLIDYPYEDLGLDVSVLGFKTKLIKDMKQIIENQIQELGLSKVTQQETKEHFVKNSLEQYLVKDIVNMNKDTALRYEKIYSYLKEIYKQKGLSNQIELNIKEKTTGKQLSVPVFSYVVGRTKLYITPVSAYLTDGKKIEVIYTMNSNDINLEDSKLKLEKIMKQLKLSEQIIHTKLIKISDINKVLKGEI